MYKLKLVAGIILTGILFSCQGMQQTARDGMMKETIRRVTPTDIKAHTDKIIINEYQFRMNRTEETNSSLYFETYWKTLDPNTTEKEAGISDVRLRIKIRSQKLRRGMDEFTVHNLNFTAELQGTTDNSTGSWNNIRITPEREEFITAIFDDYETEFKVGVMEY